VISYRSGARYYELARHVSSDPVATVGSRTCEDTVSTGYLITVVANAIRSDVILFVSHESKRENSMDIVKRELSAV
jgi:hypothetical protein